MFVLYVADQNALHLPPGSSYILEAAFKHTQAYLFNLELSTAVQFLSIAFSHYFIHNLATGPVSSPFYTVLDRDNFHLLSRTILQSLRPHMASPTASQSQKGWSSQCCHCSTPQSSSCLDQPQQDPLT